MNRSVRIHIAIAVICLCVGGASAQDRTNVRPYTDKRKWAAEASAGAQGNHIAPWASRASPAVTSPSDHAPKPPRVTSIRFSLGSGMCYGYCYSELNVEQGKASLSLAPWKKDKRCPNLVVKASLSDKHWKELTEVIDREAVIALPDTIGCLGCVDEVVESIEIQFSNHTKKGVQYNSGSAPSEIKALSVSLSNLHAKLRKELPSKTRCSY